MFTIACKSLNKHGPMQGVASRSSDRAEGQSSRNDQNGSLFLKPPTCKNFMEKVMFFSSSI